MELITFPTPPAIRGEQLRAELEAAGYQDVSVTEIAPVGGGAGMLQIAGRTAGGAPIDERSRQKIAGLLAAHRPRPLPAPATGAVRTDELAALGTRLRPDQVTELVLLLHAELRTLRPRQP